MRLSSFSITFIFLFILFLAGCSSELPEIPATDEAIEPAEHILPMRLVGDINRFADGESTRGASTTTTSWNENDSLYVQFQTTQGVIDGVAIYRSGDWQVHYWGSQSPDASSSAKVYHLCNIANPTSSPIGLSARSGVYADTLATYVYEEGVLTLTARLNPLTGRIRFRGTSGQSLTFSGLRWFSAYDTKGNLSTATGEVTLNVGSDGYTPYVYGSFADANERSLFVEQDVDNLFQKQFVNGVLDAGRSGYVSIPTATSHSGWAMTKSYREFTVSGHGKTVSIKMRRVNPGTFWMGRAGNWDFASPVHSVTITNTYYMCETEVTQDLWYAVTGSFNGGSGSEYWSSTYGSEGSCPAYYISYLHCESFLKTLNKMLASQMSSGEQFRFPTEAEWEFAAKGGTKSKGYYYAGSNNISDVAWYNSSKTHPVKTKAANELGLYDMSGNVGEWCEDWYKDYTKNAQTDPRVTERGTAENRVRRGGSWENNMSVNCCVAYRAYLWPLDCDNHTGFRLCLGAPIEQ